MFFCEEQVTEARAPPTCVTQRIKLGEHASPHEGPLGTQVMVLSTELCPSLSWVIWKKMCSFKHDAVAWALLTVWPSQQKASNGTCLCSQKWVYMSSSALNPFQRGNIFSQAWCWTQTKDKDLWSTLRCSPSSPRSIITRVLVIFCY